MIVPAGCVRHGVVVLDIWWRRKTNKTKNSTWDKQTAARGHRVAASYSPRSSADTPWIYSSMNFTALIIQLTSLLATNPASVWAGGFLSWSPRPRRAMSSVGLKVPCPHADTGTEVGTGADASCRLCAVDSCGSSSSVESTVFVSGP